MIPFHHPLETDPIILYLTQVPSLVPLLFKFCNSLRAYCSTHVCIYAYNIVRDERRNYGRSFFSSGQQLITRGRKRRKVWRHDKRYVYYMTNPGGGIFNRISNNFQFRKFSASSIDIFNEFERSRMEMSIATIGEERGEVT